MGTRSAADASAVPRVVKLLPRFALALLGGAGFAHLAGVHSSPAATQQSTPLFWYLARAAGLAAYMALFLNVCLGLAVRTKVVDWLVARWQAFDLHQFTALLALGLIGLHLAALLGDQFIGFTVPQLLVAFASPYRPLPTALGVLAMYLVVAIALSFWARPWIGQRAWRVLHYAAFGGFFLALAHGLLAGTDAATPWVWALYWGTGWLVTLLTLWRFGIHSPERSRPQATRQLALH